MCLWAAVWCVLSGLDRAIGKRLLERATGDGRQLAAGRAYRWWWAPIGSEFIKVDEEAEEQRKRKRRRRRKRKAGEAFSRECLRGEALLVALWRCFGGTLALRAQRASGLSAVCCARECVCQKAARREQAVEVSAHKAEGRTQKAEKAQKKPQSTTTRRKARAHALASIHLSVFSFGPLALCVFFRFSVRHS